MPLRISSALKCSLVWVSPERKGISLEIAWFPIKQFMWEVIARNTQSGWGSKWKIKGDLRRRFPVHRARALSHWRPLGGKMHESQSFPTQKILESEYLIHILPVVIHHQLPAECVCVCARVRMAQGIFSGTPSLPWGCHCKFSHSWLVPGRRGCRQVPGTLATGNQSVHFRFGFFRLLTGGALRSYTVPFSLGCCENKEIDCVTAFNSWSLTWKVPKDYSLHTSPLRPSPLSVAQTRSCRLRAWPETWRPNTPRTAEFHADRVAVSLCSNGNEGRGGKRVANRNQLHGSWMALSLNFSGPCEEPGKSVSMSPFLMESPRDHFHVRLH